MGRNVTQVIFDEWNKIFGRNITGKQINFKCDSVDKGNYYIEMTIQDHDGNHLISERSLGFRWFFVFLLLTQFRGFRRNMPKNVLFLFDEPASNLHPTAQAKLLDSFEKLTSKCKVLYTTHSHYMINPKWLEGTYVVKNEGLNYQEDEDKYSSKKTNIKLEQYRQFVIKNPDQTTYFQPILDLLDYYSGN